MNQIEKTPEAKNRNRAKNRAANQAALVQLCETYPDVFSRENVRPLKVGIQEDLIADEKLARNRIKRALASYVRSPQYLRSLQPGADRIGLDGTAAGQVSEEEASHAREKLKAIKDQRREREKTERKEERKQAVKAKEQPINKKLDMLLQLNSRNR
ncbi:MAG: DNA competence protein [Oceanospirillales bacterium]|nr:DNA competence protein [Oceanospirillales bacterium]